MSYSTHRDTSLPCQGEYTEAHCETASPDSLLISTALSSAFNRGSCFILKKKRHLLFVESVSPIFYLVPPCSNEKVDYSSHLYQKRSNGVPLATNEGGPSIPTISKAFSLPSSNVHSHPVGLPDKFLKRPADLRRESARKNSGFTNARNTYKYFEVTERSFLSQCPAVCAIHKSQISSPIPRL